MVVVMAGADEAATLQFLAPYTGATVAEYFNVGILAAVHVSNAL